MKNCTVHMRTLRVQTQSYFKVLCDPIKQMLANIFKNCRYIGEN